MTERTIVMAGPEIAAYGFPNGHPFGPDRHDAFMAELERSPVFDDLAIEAPVGPADRAVLETFHTGRYVDFVRDMSAIGHGYLDNGDTPAFPGVYEAAAAVVAGTVAVLDLIMTGTAKRGFIPIGGLHHARRDAAAGFCVFNDCGIAIERARERYGLTRIAYVDIDAHHGDGVYYGFEADPVAIIADTHEDGRYLYPGTGRRDEIGRGEAAGTKLNIPLPPGAGDDEFEQVWPEVVDFVEAARPEFVIMQCGADSLDGDPITHLRFSENAHARAARDLCDLADSICDGRIIGTGGGGYNRHNIARAWTRVVAAFAE
jgi:acetoin utilization protein AcuC